MVRVDFRVNYDAGGIPLSWNWQVWDIGKNVTLYFYLDGELIHNQKGNNNGHLIEQGHTIAVGDRPDFVNVGSFSISIAPETGNVGKFIADGIVFEFKRVQL